MYVVVEFFMVIAFMLLGIISSQAAISPGDILVIDAGRDFGDGGTLFKVNPLNGKRTVISDFNDVDQGETGSAPRGVIMGNARRGLVIDRSAGTTFRGALFSVRLSNGRRTLITDFNV